MSFLAQGVNFLLSQSKAHVRINPGSKGFLVELVDRSEGDCPTDRCLFSCVTWDVSEGMRKVQDFLYASKRQQESSQANAAVAG